MKLDNLTENLAGENIGAIPKKMDSYRHRMVVDVNNLKKQISNSSKGILEVGCRFYANFIKVWLQQNFIGYEAKVIEKESELDVRYLVHFNRR